MDTIHRRHLGTIRSWSVSGFDRTIRSQANIRRKTQIQSNKQYTEYEGLVLGLSKAKASGAKTLLIKTDSQVVAGQVEKEYLTHNTELAKYLAVVRGLERRFKGFTLQYIPRAENNEVDELAKAAANNLALLEGT